MKRLDSSNSTEDRRKYKIMRTDNYLDVPGEILTADEATGRCTLQIAGGTKELDFGSGGIRIVPRGRLDPVISAVSAAMPASEPTIEFRYLEEWRSTNLLGHHVGV